MYKQQSLSKLSSKSLSKIKTKIELAFARPKTNQNQSKNQQNLLQARSNSTKSLARSKYQSSEKNIPFSIAVKNGMIHTDRKIPSFSLPTANLGIKKHKLSVRVKQNNKTAVKKIQFNVSLVFQMRLLRDGHGFTKKVNNQYHYAKTIRINCQGEGREGNKKDNCCTVAQIYDQLEDKLYSGSKNILLIKSNKQKLFDKSESAKIEVQDCDFVLVIDENLLYLCNINRIITEIYQLIIDGLNNLDTIANIIGRKIVQLQKKSQKKKIQIKFFC